MTSVHSSERIEEMIFELEGYRRDAVLLNETWRPCQVWKLGDTSQTHIHGSREIRQQTRSWNYAEQEVATKKHWYWVSTSAKGHHNNDFGRPSKHQANERILSPHRVCRPSRRKMYRTIEKTRFPAKSVHRLLEETWTLNWSQDTELGVPALARTHSRRKRKRRLAEALADIARFQSTQHDRQKNAWKTTYRSPKGTEKQIDYILIKRRHLKCNKDAEANDMIYMGSDHRCVMATFVINTPEKIAHHETIKDKLETTKQNNRKRTDKKSEKKNLRSKKDTKRWQKRSKKKPLIRQKPKQTRKWKESSSAIKKAKQERILAKQV